MYQTHRAPLKGKYYFTTNVLAPVQLFRFHSVSKINYNIRRLHIDALLCVCNKYAIDEITLNVKNNYCNVTTQFTCIQPYRHNVIHSPGCAVLFKLNVFEIRNAFQIHFQVFSILKKYKNT